MPTLHELADRLWRGEDRTTIREHHPFAPLNQIEEITRDVAFYKSFSNIAAVTTEAGLVLIDTGSYHPVAHQRSFDKVRSWTSQPLHTAIYTHGHVDHAYGLPPFLRESKERGWTQPSIIGHDAVPARMKRYILTEGYNAVINNRQFQTTLPWPTEPDYPTLTYHDRLQLNIGGKPFDLFHAKGETDDHTWVFLPEERVLYTGDLFIWAAPNAGNPQKVQRYCIEWAQALRAMAALEPNVLLPGHGLLIAGTERVREALLDTAGYLESLHTQTLALMNQGATLDDILHCVKPPAHLIDKPYLQPIYDEPEFIVRNIYRCYGGWYNGVPSELKPAPRREQANEIALLAGGVAKLLERAAQQQATGNLQLACHLLDWAVEAVPDDLAAHRLRAEVYEQRAGIEPSTMSKGIFAAAARDSRAKLLPEN